MKGFIRDFFDKKFSKYKGQKMTWRDAKIGIVSIIVGGSIALVWFLISTVIDSNKSSKIAMNHCQTVCEVTDVRINRGTYILFDHFVDEKRFNGRCPSPFGACVGDHYLLYYQCDNPDNFDVKSDSIIFLKEEINDTISARVLTIEKKEGFLDFRFLDKDGNVISKTQETTPFLINRINTKVAKVIYLKNNPSKAILQ